MSDLYEFLCIILALHFLGRINISESFAFGWSVYCEVSKRKQKDLNDT